MVNLKRKNKYNFCGATIFLLISAISAFGQSYFVNGYSLKDGDFYNNVLYEINLESKEIADSIIFNVQGEFVDKLPTLLRNNQGRSVLLIFFTNGVAGKNSHPLDTAVTYYYMINENSFTIIRADRIISNIALSVKNKNGDTLDLDCIDIATSEDIERHYAVNWHDNMLQEIGHSPYRNRGDNNVRIGNYINPYLLASHARKKYYYAFYGDSYVNIFSTQNDSVVTSEMHAGDYAQESIIIGYSPANNLIYNFDLRYKLLSSYPPAESPDSIQNAVTIIDGLSFRIVNSIRLDLGDDVYIAKELGEADYIDGYLVYYFARSDGYGQFDPAYLLIFDTRTNEAFWLRVGWR